jgi:hypothetical protein
MVHKRLVAFSDRGNLLCLSSGSWSSELLEDQPLSSPLLSSPHSRANVSPPEAFEWQRAPPLAPPRRGAVSSFNTSDMWGCVRYAPLSAAQNGERSCVDGRLKGTGPRRGRGASGWCQDGRTSAERLAGADRWPPRRSAGPLSVVTVGAAAWERSANGETVGAAPRGFPSSALDSSCLSLPAGAARDSPRHLPAPRIPSPSSWNSGPLPPCHTIKFHHF